MIFFFSHTILRRLELERWLALSPVWAWSVLQNCTYTTLYYIIFQFYVMSVACVMVILSTRSPPSIPMREASVRRMLFKRDSASTRWESVFNSVRSCCDYLFTQYLPSRFLSGDYRCWRFRTSQPTHHPFRLQTPFHSSQLGDKPQI